MKDVIKTLWREEVAAWNVITRDHMGIPESVMRDHGMSAWDVIAFQDSGMEAHLEEANKQLEILFQASPQTPRAAIWHTSLSYGALYLTLDEAEDELSSLQTLMLVASKRGSVLALIGKIDEKEVLISMGRKALATAGANALHAENRAMKADVFAWLDAHMKNFKSMDKAAEAIAGKIAPIAFRTARAWVGEWKKLRSAGTT
ncbi:hypothetical protein [Aquabacterium sp.]|uniref:hypothetical protein n=1 Tax=Aquabacterium sp. TaxID=1872578 RepID=UPI0035B4E8B8